ncbi:MAG: hypothetical protein CVU14_11450, partial [Bacteroidetes bacterium HGW-Bacteroidetes-9]
NQRHPCLPTGRRVLSTNCDIEFKSSMASPFKGSMTLGHSGLCVLIIRSGLFVFNGRDARHRVSTWCDFGLGYSFFVIHIGALFTPYSYLTTPFLLFPSSHLLPTPYSLIPTHHSPLITHH